MIELAKHLKDYTQGFITKDELDQRANALHFNVDHYTLRAHSAQVWMHGDDTPDHINF